MNSMKKNDIFCVKIEDISEEGLGIGHIDGMAVFVKGTAVGDVADVRLVKLKKTYAFGRLERIVEPSPYRVTPDCPVADKCGGCTLQHMSYESELELKKTKVLSCLERIGGIEDPEQYLEGVFGMEDSYLRYRNKMQFPVGVKKVEKDGAEAFETAVGFYAGRTHSIIPVDDCLTGHEVNKYVIDAVKSWIDSGSVSVYDERTGKGLVRHILTRVGKKTGELMVCLVINGREVPESERLVEGLKKAVESYIHKVEEKKISVLLELKSVVLNINKESTNRIMGDRSVVLYGEDFIRDKIGDLTFRISPESFYQVNPVQTEKLYDKALEYAELTGAEDVWDMYCGIGTISLFLAKNAGKVRGVEIVPQAIEDAKKNAAENDITNAEFYVGKAEDVVNEWDAGRPDVIVVDPPRKGCDEKLLETICGAAPERVVYVSCNPATLARDLKYLIERGFKIEKLSIYDQFCRSLHVETVVKLKK